MLCSVAFNITQCHCIMQYFSIGYMVHPGFLKGVPLTYMGCTGVLKIPDTFTIPVRARLELAKSDDRLFFYPSQCQWGRELWLGQSDDLFLVINFLLRLFKIIVEHYPWTGLYTVTFVLRLIGFTTKTNIDKHWSNVPVDGMMNYVFQQTLN